MIAAPVRKRKRRQQQRVEVAQTLCAIVKCGALAVAIPADAVTFIALAEDAQVSQRDGRLNVVVGAVQARGLYLGDLLALDAPATSWLFLRTHGDDVIALGCGECVTVQKLADPDPLPRGVFRAGGDAIIGAFRVDDALLERGCSIAGVWVDPARLVDGAVRERA